MPRATLTWFTVAAGIGTVHAAASLYWALGGDALADTVGAWAVAWRTASPVAAGSTLAAIGLVKLTAASVPLTAARRGRPHGALRLVCWAGSALLVAYGLANTAAANLALTGMVGAVDDLAATRGHAWLWDPLFLAWGLALGVGLWQTRRRPAPGWRPARSDPERPQDPVLVLGQVPGEGETAEHLERQGERHGVVGHALLDPGGRGGRGDRELETEQQDGGGREGDSEGDGAEVAEVVHDGPSGGGWCPPRSSCAAPPTSGTTPQIGDPDPSDVAPRMPVSR